MKKQLSARTLIAFLWLASVGFPVAAENSTGSAESETIAAKPVYMYDIAFQSNEMSASGTIDPSGPNGERVTIHSPSPEQWPEGFENQVNDLDETPVQDFWCSELKENIPEGAKLVSEFEGINTYEFRPLPPADSKEDAKFVKHLIGRATIDTADGEILSFTMDAEKPFKPALVAKVDTFSMQIICERSPDGRTFAASSETEVSGTALMQRFDERMKVTISNLRPTTN